MMGCVLGMEDEIESPSAQLPNPLEIDLTHFTLHHVLGSGGFGIVQYAVKMSAPDCNRPYAVKSLSKASVLKRRTGFASIFAELKILSIIDSPFICNAHYAFQDSCYLYLVIDLARGGDLRYNLNISGHKFSEDRAKFYICQIILAIEHLHKLRILHRDIKPENILLNDDGYVKLTDFGVSKLLPNIEDCRSTSGTHGYMAPELYIPPTYVHGPPADWFALGVTLHELLTGSRPFDSKKIKALQKSPYNLPLSRLERADYLSPACKSFISRLLCTQPYRRLREGYGAHTIRGHEWLMDVDWALLSRRQAQPPVIPDVDQPRCCLGAAEAEELMRSHLSASAIPDHEQYKFEKYAFRNKLGGGNDSFPCIGCVDPGRSPISGSSCTTPESLNHYHAFQYNGTGSTTPQCDSLSSPMLCTISHRPGTPLHVPHPPAGYNTLLVDTRREQPTALPNWSPGRLQVCPSSASVLSEVDNSSFPHPSKCSSHKYCTDIECPNNQRSVVNVNSPLYCQGS